MTTRTFKSPEDLARFFLKTAKKVEKDMINELNRLAFTTRKEVIEKTIPETMTIRNKGLIRHLIRVEKASPGHLVAICGEIKKDDFSGMSEQEVGGKSNRHLLTLQARNRNIKRKLPKKHRLSQGSIKKDSDFVGDFNSPEHQSRAFIAKLKTSKYKGSFLLENHPKLPRGLYKFKGKKIVTLQVFNPTSLKPTRARYWLRKAIQNVLRRPRKKKPVFL